MESNSSYMTFTGCNFKRINDKFDSFKDHEVNVLQVSFNLNYKVWCTHDTLMIYALENKSHTFIKIMLFVNERELSRMHANLMIIKWNKLIR